MRSRGLQAQTEVWLSYRQSTPETRSQASSGLPVTESGCHRPSKRAVICSRVLPLVSGTEVTVKRTLRTQKAAVSQKAP